MFTLEETNHLKFINYVKNKIMNRKKHLKINCINFNNHFIQLAMEDLHDRKEKSYFDDTTEIEQRHLPIV